VFVASALRRFSDSGWVEQSVMGGWLITEEGRTILDRQRVARSEHFTSPRPNLIESDDGFAIEVLGRTGLRYSESGKSVWIDSEVLSTPAITVYSRSINHWDAPYDSTSIGTAERVRILDNIRWALESRGEDLQVS